MAPASLQAPEQIPPHYISKLNIKLQGRKEGRKEFQTSLRKIRFHNADIKG
jgi:hypothetical protein